MYRRTGDPDGAYYLTKVASHLNRDVDFIMSISEPYSICIYIESCHYDSLTSLLHLTYLARMADLGTGCSALAYLHAGVDL